VFEYIYFARADSVLDGISVYEARKNLGRALARRDDVAADLVIPVPDSAVPAAIGYAQEARLPFEMGLVRSPYVGRTFIEPEQNIRHFGVRLKHNAVREVLGGKRVVVVDDSIVRGTTSRKIVKMVRAAGASEVHLRISSPQVAWPCYYGIDTPTRSELIAQSHTVDEINQYLTSDSLSYLPLEQTQAAVLEGLVRRDAAGLNGRAHVNGDAEKRSLPLAPAAIDGKLNDRFCHACFSGDYPVAFQEMPKSRQMRLLDF
jgi:amidophosphoribosyltransferase